MTETLIDSYRRKLDYLRISVTHHCNFRCNYCLPPEESFPQSSAELLERKELERLASLFVKLGVQHIRLTGGEPLLYKEILPFLEGLSSFESLQKLTLTTNGALLSKQASDLRRAGLSGVNVSLDSLDRERFRRITHFKDLDLILEGIHAALDQELRVKINVVALSDLSKEEVLQFLELAKTYPLDVRFIEFMPLCGKGWRPDRVLPISTIKNWIGERSELLPQWRGSQVAETFAVTGGKGGIGFIASLSSPFCDSCNRLRLTATGELRPCLFSDRKVELRPLLRNRSPDSKLIEAIRMAVEDKPESHLSIHEGVKPHELPRIRFLGG